MERYYKPSGEAPLAGVISTLITGLTATAILAALYSAGQVWIPSAKLRIILPLLYGMAIGVVAALLMKKGNIRSPRVRTGIGAALGIAGAYSAWVAWLSFMMHSEGALTLIWDPVTIAEIAHMMAGSGVWTFDKNLTPTGVTLEAIWATEALCIVVSAAAVASFMFRNLPFCERCNRWVEDAVTIGPLALCDNRQVKLQADMGNLEPLAELAPVADPVAGFTRLEVRSCKRCSNFHVLSAVNVGPAKGGNKPAEKAFITNLVIDAHTYQRLERKGGGETGNPES